MHEGQEDLHRTYAGQRFCEAVPTKDAPAACGWVCLCVCVSTEWKPCVVLRLWLTTAQRTSKAKVSATSAPLHEDLAPQATQMLHV